MYSLINKINLFFENFKKSLSFSQYGEDKIIWEMLGLFGLKNVNYIDIGAHHPYNYSNTALLYRKGIYGINIEPDIHLFKKFLKVRKKDINLNIGIHDKKGESTLFQFEKPEFNTFSIEAARSIEDKAIKKVGESKIKINTYNNIVNEYLHGKAPDILFLDAEGLDEQILKSIDFEKFAPKIICVETYAYGIGKKNYEIIKFLKNKKYSIHADTFVNTIFVQTKIAGGVLF